MHFIYKNFNTSLYQGIYLFDAQFIGSFCIEHTLYSLKSNTLRHAMGSINAEGNFSTLELCNLNQVHLPSNCSVDREPDDIFHELISDLNNPDISSILIIFKGKIKMDYLKFKFNSSKLIFKTYPEYFSRSLKCSKGVLGGKLCSLSNVKDMKLYYNW